jgi:hypothetical protein
LYPLLDDDVAKGITASSARPRHLLWALVFLKVYASEDVHCCLVGYVDAKTYRKWAWWVFH